MAEQYFPGAELHLMGNGGTMDGSGQYRVVWHYTGDKDASADEPQDLVAFDNVIGWFTGSGKGSAPQILWDPFTGRVAQFIPAGQSARALVNQSGGVETNRDGNVCIQVETLFFPYCRTGGKVYATIADTPRKGLAELMTWLRSWGVPDVWPMGQPDGGSQRNPSIWTSTSGHYGHSQVPENNHTDPGPMGDIFNNTEDGMTPDQIAGAPIPFRGADGQQTPVTSNVADFLNYFVQGQARLEAVPPVADAPVLYKGVDGQQTPVTSNVGDFLNNFVQAHARIEASLARIEALLAPPSA